MARHRDVHLDTLGFHHGVNFGDASSCDRRFEIVFCSTVLKREEALPYWITVANSPIIDKSHLNVSPAEQIAGDLASQGT